ncbi:hypothetical protein ABH926_000204 [Catenulispora sp. GP43]|uniref:hypothetical protein n=1 Tax=Catenulispora sp. GP43 TaxID=3156263 RepID=UPI0035116414
MSCAAIVLIIGGCGGTGGSSPSSVEDRAAKLTAESLAVLTPAPNQAVERTEWSPCSEDTPGVHRFSYERVIHLSVDKAASQPVFDQELAYWGKQGYVLDPQEPNNPTRSARPYKNDADWSVGVGFDNDGQMFLSVDANCVHVSSDPKTS